MSIKDSYIPSNSQRIHFYWRTNGHRGKGFKIKRVELFRVSDMGSTDSMGSALHYQNSPERFYKPWFWNLLRRKKLTEINQILKERWESSYRMTWMKVDTKGLALNPKYSSVLNSWGPKQTQFKNKYWVHINSIWLGDDLAEEFAITRLNSWI